MFNLEDFPFNDIMPEDDDIPKMVIDKEFVIKIVKFVYSKAETQFAQQFSLLNKIFHIYVSIGVLEGYEKIDVRTPNFAVWFKSEESWVYLLFNTKSGEWEDDECEKILDDY